MNDHQELIGHSIHELARKLWPINRSLTGEGVRQTLVHLREHLRDLKVVSVPSGTKVFDWTVPKEWRVKEAFIITPSGEKICDFKKNNLHLLGYSTPFEGEVEFNDLKEHLYTLPEQPDAIPYLTSYYEERWGFCLSHRQFENLKKGKYHVKIDAQLFDGVLNYGELLLEGKVSREVFISTYICHPSMANNELSGPSVVTYLAKWLTELKQREYTYRIIFIPETIGSITYLSRHYKHLKQNVFAGFNVTCVGDNRTYSYVPSRRGDTLSDHVARHVLKNFDPHYKAYTWLDRGSDERQYCAPGIDLPIASIMRSKYMEYPEYHTSLDDLENVVTPEGLNGGYWALRRAIEAIERNKKYTVTVLCEPQMGKRGLFPTLSIKKSRDVRLLMDLISLLDGESTLIDIAEYLMVPVWHLYDLVESLENHGLVKVHQ